eukprot:1983182-Karenia_brevis.AAC.1
MVDLGHARQVNGMTMQGCTFPSHTTTREHLRPPNPCADTAVSKGADAHLFMFYWGMPRRGGRHG